MEEKCGQIGDADDANTGSSLTVENQTRVSVLDPRHHHQGISSSISRGSLIDQISRAVTTLPATSTLSKARMSISTLASLGFLGV